jgi:hypothetical protein
MAVKARSARQADLEAELADAIERATVLPAMDAVLETLTDLRRQGLQRAQYNLVSPYGEGLQHMRVAEED